MSAIGELLAVTGSGLHPVELSLFLLTHSSLPRFLQNILKRCLTGENNRAQSGMNIASAGGMESPQVTPFLETIDDQEIILEVFFRENVTGLSDILHVFI